MMTTLRILTALSLGVTLLVILRQFARDFLTKEVSS